ncbi:glycosyltransferase [Frankia sp. R82]|uniref:glycosyltransferase family 4 protein n=1 Tax=Frankia sp. R82 TaxID=2950553 RepID=UPI0020438892|nr:glycosyltransferase [Frankia sp. R82]MCM3887280.1 glycosyltransferase [Frankia sp. R82]
MTTNAPTSTTPGGTMPGDVTPGDVTPASTMPGDVTVTGSTVTGSTVTGSTAGGRPRQILQVTARYLPDLGGTETHVHEVGRRLGRLDDIELTVLATDRSGRRPRVQEADGFTVLRRRAWPAERDYHIAPGLSAVIRDGGWDLVHVQGIHTAVPLIAMRAARAADIPYVVTFHTGGHSSAARTSMRSLQWRALVGPLRDAAHLIGVSRFERDLFARVTGLAPERFSVIRNGGGLPPAPADLRPVPGRIVSIGRLERYKGHHRAIVALAAARRQLPEAHLVILGSGPYEPELRALAVRLGVEAAVEIRSVPPGDREAMARELTCATVVAALSEYEAHPVAVMEALALGVPVVGLDVAGIGDLVADGLVGGLPTQSSAEQVAGALLTAAAGPRARTAELPTWEICADSIAQVYRTVLAADGAKPAAAHPGTDLSHGSHAADHGDRRVRTARGRRWRRRAPRPADESPVRVVHVITALAAGGAERQVQQLVGQSISETTVICLYGGGVIADELQAAGHRVQVLGMDGWRRAAAPLRLARRLHQLRPDVVHVHLLAAQLWGLPAARLARVPVVVSTEHSLMRNSVEGRPLTPTLRRAYLLLERLATHTVAVSSATAGRLTDWGVCPARMSVIANGVDVDASAFSATGRRSVRAELGVADHTSLVGAVGRLDPVKRFDVLIDAVAPSLTVGERELVIVGAGAERDALRERCAWLGVTEAVHFLGARSDIPAVLSAFDVLVSPSRDETFGLAVVEAVANGLPVVYGQAPALSELTRPPRTATQIPLHLDAPAERAALATAVDNALAAGPRGGEAPAELRERYAISNVADTIDILYRRLLIGRSTVRRTTSPRSTTRTNHTTSPDHGTPAGHRPAPEDRWPPV